jgi:hypothetical protein
MAISENREGHRRHHVDAVGNTIERHLDVLVERTIADPRGAERVAGRDAVAELLFLVVGKLGGGHGGKRAAKRMPGDVDRPGFGLQEFLDGAE